MKNKIWVVLWCVGFSLPLSWSWAADPIVERVEASQPAGSKSVDIWYDVRDDDADRLTVSLAVSTNGGAAYDLPASSFTADSDIGSVVPGNIRHIVWNAGTDWPGNESSQVRFKITASEEVSGPLGEMVVNGDFSGGNAYFSTDFTYIPPPPNLENETTYSIITNPDPAHSAWASYGDHTTGSGLMMAVNGCVSTPKVVWSQTVSVSANSRYRFGMWVASPHDANRGILGVSINGYPVILGYDATAPLGVWRETSGAWESGSARSAVIEITDQRCVAYGNDYTIDDITFAADAGEDSLESNIMYVDTRDHGERPIVQDVISLYCSRQRHVFFLGGAPLSVDFDADINWNGKTPGNVEYVVPGGTTYAGETASRTFDVENFPVRKRMIVTAIASDGTRSLPFTVNFDVIPPPAGMTGRQLAQKSGVEALVYETPDPVDCVLVDVGLDAVPEEVPIFGGKQMELLIDIPCHYEIFGDGTAISEKNLGDNWSFSIGGFDVVPEFEHFFSFSYDPGCEKWYLNQGDLSVGLDSPELKLGEFPFVGPFGAPMFVEFSLQAAITLGL